MPEIENRLAELCRSMNKGFEQIHQDLSEVRADVKDIHRQGVPHRVKALEEWKSATSGRLWTFLVGSAIAAVGAWVAVLIR